MPGTSQAKAKTCCSTTGLVAFRRHVDYAESGELLDIIVGGRSGPAFAAIFAERRFVEENVGQVASREVVSPRQTISARGTKSDHSTQADDLCNGVRSEDSSHAGGQ